MALNPTGSDAADQFYRDLCQSAELAELLRALMDYMATGLRLPEPLRGLAVFVAAAKYQPQTARFFATIPNIQQTGLPDAMVEALTKREMPSGMSADQAAVYAYCIQIRDNCRVDNKTYAALVGRFDAAICLEIAMLMGSVAAMAMLVNVIVGATPTA